MIGNNKTLIEFLSKQDEDTLFELTKKQEKSLRSLAQNRYYFGVVLFYICDFIGIEHKFEIMEMHNQIKEHFGLETTTDLSTSEFKAMCEEIRAWYLEQRGLYIPLPRESEDLKDLEKYLF